MPPERMEIKKKGLALWLEWALRLACWLSSSRMPECLCCSCLHVPTDGIWMDFGWEGTPGQPGLGWPGTGWQGYSSLGVLEGTTSEAEACYPSKIV